ncbi:MAG: HU family DNA-binding protein [Lachnospiraceae bacterium]|nr:HU family DNA-binding protein [Lachnospiraceae bacterium]
MRKEMRAMARRPRNEYANWIHLLSETSAIRELLVAELENLSPDCNTKFIKESIMGSPGIGDKITKKVFDTFIELIGVKIMESQDKEFYIPNFGTFAVKTHRGHKMKLNPREEDGQVVDIPDYKMLRFKPDDNFKSDVLMID